MSLEMDNLAVIDWELGLKLAGGKKDLAQDMLTLLVRDLPDDRMAINQLLAEQNYSHLLARVHKLHGAVSYCGTPRLKTILSDVESQLKANQTSELKAMIKQLNHEIDELITQVTGHQTPL
jgi:two-component system sensor histidine kinase BarA